MQLIKELYTYREMIFSLVRRDLKGRYKGSVLGFVWTFLNPLLQLMIYTVVFSIILKSDIKDFYLFLFVALVPWIFFSTSAAGSANCIWGQQDMVKKIYFPREVLPIAFVTSQFINMLLSFLVVFSVIVVFGKGINFLAMLSLPLVMLIEYILALSIAMIVSSVTVFLRDVEYVLGLVIMAWQFMTPIMYPITSVPIKLHPLFYINPMTPVVIAYRDILYYKKVPEFTTLIHATILGVIMLLIGVGIFGHLKKRFAEVM